VYRLVYQVVWCLKCRWPVSGGRAGGRCEELMWAEAAGRGWRMAALAIITDHVRLLVKAHRSGSPFPVASEFQRFTPRCLRAEFAHLESRLPTSWSESYFAAMAGAVPMQTVRRYADTQDERRWRKERAW